MTHHPKTEDQDILIDVSGISKKFCRNLKQAMFYTLADIGQELIGRDKTIELRRNEFLSINDVSLKVRRGECLGLIGHNGAGKTTLLKMINGLFPPDKGSITVKGRVGALIALGAGFNPVLSGRENIFVNAAVLGINRAVVRERFDDIVAFAELEKFIDAPVQSYSSGMQARLGFAVAAHLDPDVLLVDEILSVGDVSFQARCFDRMGEIKEQGAAIVFVSHNMHQIGRFCDKGIYLKHGEVRESGIIELALDKYFLDQKSSKLTSGSEQSVIPELGKADKVAITNAHFLDPKTKERIDQGNPAKGLAIRIGYELKIRDDMEIVIEIMLRDGDGILFQTTSDLGGELIQLSTEKGTIDLYLQDLRSQNDVLDLSVVFWNKTKTEILTWKRGFKIEMEGLSQSSGRSLLSTEWKINDQLIDD